MRFSSNFLFCKIKFFNLLDVNFINFFSYSSPLLIHIAHRYCYIIIVTRCIKFIFIKLVSSHAILARKRRKNGLYFMFSKISLYFFLDILDMKKNCFICRGPPKMYITISSSFLFPISFSYMIIIEITKRNNTKQKRYEMYFFN
jgi:hypothetical protein